MREMKSGDWYRDARAAFEHRFPEHVHEFPGVASTGAQVATFLTAHMPDLCWHGMYPSQVSDLIRNYPKGE